MITIEFVFEITEGEFTQYYQIDKTGGGPIYRFELNLIYRVGRGRFLFFSILPFILPGFGPGSLTDV